MKKKQFAAAVMFVAISAFTIMACNKQVSKDVEITEPAATEKIQTLAQRFTQPVGNDYLQVVNAYQSLSETDLRIFWHQINLVNKKAGHSTLTDREFSSLFDKINLESKTKTGQPFNKVSGSSLNLAIDVRDNSITSRPPVDPPPGGCIFYAYPINLYENNTLPSSPPFFTYSIVDYWPDDCDGVEAVYSGTWTASKSLTPLGIQTGPVYPIGRYESGNTKVLFKKSVMLMAFGSIANINNHKRMANGGIFESR